MPRLYVMVCLYIKINYQINYGNIFHVILHSYAFSHRPSAHLCMPASCLLPYVFLVFLGVRCVTQQKENKIYSHINIILEYKIRKK